VEGISEKVATNPDKRTASSGAKGAQGDTGSRGDPGSKS
jgi:hypothetical protein